MAWYACTTSSHACASCVHGMAWHGMAAQAVCMAWHGCASCVHDMGGMLQSCVHDMGGMPAQADMPSTHPTLPGVCTPTAPVHAPSPLSSSLCSAARKTTITLNLSRQISGFEGAPAGGEAQTPGVDSLGLGAAAVPKRPPSTAPRKAPTPTPQPAVQPVEQGYQRNRRAAAAGVHALAAEVSAMEEDDPEEQQHAQHVQHVQQQQQQRGAAPQLQMPHVSRVLAWVGDRAVLDRFGCDAGVPAVGMPLHSATAPTRMSPRPHMLQVQVQQVAPAPTHGRTSAEVARMFSEREPLIPGLNHASDRPQVRSRVVHATGSHGQPWAQTRRAAAYCEPCAVVAMTPVVLHLRPACSQFPPTAVRRRPAGC